MLKWRRNKKDGALISSCGTSIIKKEFGGKVNSFRGFRIYYNNGSSKNRFGETQKELKSFANKLIDNAITFLRASGYIVKICI